ncbi:SusC/RagA family TonB-linked outer membrane protein [Pedobacter jejuensis]|uniref:TonB-dependent receptor n=1 Tax=Pedobacter jejuensis TaxID=1268550 RepID=A0A3N0BPP5_9SPHI|nr:TonB-dependent receptor [Pedobacter jejuensis]RNL50779.1 TonB-dependent receptor [Pedobacter jejuensis]
MKKLLQSLFVLVFIAFTAVAQERTITGTVTSKEDGLPLPGVSVKIKGSSNGVSTTADGRYTIKMSSASGILEFTSVGFLTLSKNVGSANVVNAVLETDAKTLTDVVVVGYGSVSRKDVTGSQSSISAKEFNDRAIPSFDKALAGKAAGVQVITPSGLLGQPAQVRIRGTNTITSGQGPLYVVDGVPIVSGDVGGFTSSNALGDINPNDIESFEVLKDGASTAIYGSRAAGGVILITTKKGKAGQSTFTYDGYYAVGKVSKRYDQLNAAEFIEIANERLVAAGNLPQAFSMPDGQGGIVDTDWQDFLFRTATQQNHSVSASGGTDKAKYYFSLGYSDQEGVIIANSLKRYSIKANFDQKVNKVFSFGLTSGFTYQDNTGPQTGSNTLSGNIFGGLRMLPNVPVYDATNVTGYNIAPNRTALGRGNNLITISDNIGNQRFVLDNNIRRSQSYRLLATAYAEVNIFDGLKFRTQVGVDNQNIDDFTYTDPRAGDGVSSNGSLSQVYSPFIRLDLQNVLSYNKTFAESHNLSVTLVQEFQNDRSSFFQSTVSNLTDIYWNQNIITGTFVTPTAAGALARTALESYLARVNYNYKNRYYIGGSIRSDKNSNLPEANRKGYFPGVSAAYRISEESFFKNSSSLDFVSDLRIRGSYAEVGNVNIGNFRYLGQYNAAVYGAQAGIGFSNIGNYNLQWESQKKVDVGLELGLFDSRINFTTDYFRQNTDGLVQNAPTAPSLGVPSNTITQNIGNIVNSGFEFSLGGDVVRTEDFTYNANITFTTQKNVVGSLREGQDQIGTYNIIRVGESLNAFYGYEYAGVNPANGNPLYVKGNGQIIQGNITNQTYNVYDPANPGATGANAILSATTDKKVLGKSLPTWFGGFNNTFTYKGFDLNVFLRFQGGNKIYNRTRVDQLNQNFVNNGAEILGRWQSPANPGDGVTPRQWFGRSTFINRDGDATTRFLEDGKFLRLDNVALGYKVPVSFSSKLKVSNIRLYASAQNLFVITGYKGLDPETNTTGAGVDFNGNPQQRTFTFGLNVSF